MPDRSKGTGAIGNGGGAGSTPAVRPTETISYSEIYLETCASQYVASVTHAPEAPGHWLRSKDVLREAAVAYAASLGNLSAAERSELLALRRYREGVLGLREELKAGRTALGEPVDRKFTIETIDALVRMTGLEAP